jgi:hypothetical protein
MITREGFHPVLVVGGALAQNFRSSANRVGKVGRILAS